MSLVVNGSIGIDSVITPTDQRENVLGGSAVYFSAAASFFTSVRLVAAVGEDFPDKFNSVFDHFKIDIAGLEKRAGSKTFAWTGKYLDNMADRETVSVDLNVLAEALPPIPDSFKDSKYIFLANTHPAAQQSLIDSFPDARLFVADTMDLWIKTEQDAVASLLKQVHGLVLNDSEAELLTGTRQVEKASRLILDMGPEFVVIKKGPHGCLLRHKDGIAVLPAFPTEQVIDPTGAGDSFAGGMMGYLAQVDKVDFPAIKRAIAYGTVVASFNIESFTLDRLMAITREDIDERLNELSACLWF